jgi:hypothetical protein
VTCLTAHIYVQENVKVDSVIVESIGVLNKTKGDAIRKAFEGTKAGGLHVDGQIGTTRKEFFT